LCDLLGDWHRVARGAFGGRAHFGDDAWPAYSRTRTDQWHCAPSSAGPHLLETLLSSTRTGAALLAAFHTLNGPLRDSQTSKRQVRDAPEARSGVVAGAGAVVKRRPVPIGGVACGGVHCSRLTRPQRRVHTSLRCCLVRYGVPVEPSRGESGTRWPLAPRRGGGWIRLTFPRPPIIVNRLSSCLVVMTGAQSGSRFISFWRRVRAA
jgi:hypothetical protein